MKNSDIWREGYSLALTGGLIIENYPAAPAGDGLAEEILMWGDRYPFVGQVKVDVIGGPREVHIDRHVA
jgi:hypothetical protein